MRWVLVPMTGLRVIENAMSEKKSREKVRR